MLNSSVSSSGDLVLIDTWWNVNMLAIAELVSTFCFNRYMVECKLLFSGFTATFVLRFNRYMVECKSIQSSYLVGCGLCFNRYMVECKSI